MKSKEFIRLLQEADPSGEVEVCIGNVDIHFVSLEPAYWDGPLQVLARDPAKAPYYNITGGKYVRTGSKVQVHILSVTDAICNDTTTAVDYSELSEPLHTSYRESDDKTRVAIERIERDIERTTFLDWAKNRGLDIASSPGVLECAARFFEEHVDHRAPVPAHIRDFTEPHGDGTRRAHLSPDGMRRKQWSEQIDVSFDGFDWEMKFKGSE